MIAKEYQCVCHTFCQDLGLNSWKVVFVFVPSEIDLEVGVSDLCIMKCVYSLTTCRH